MTQAWDFVDAYVLWQGQRDLPTDFLRKRICEIDFGARYSPRIWNTCACFDELVFDPETGKYEYVPQPVITVADAVKLNEAEWLRMPNFGRRSLAAMRTVFAEHGLTFGMR